MLPVNTYVTLSRVEIDAEGGSIAPFALMYMLGFAPAKWIFPEQTKVNRITAANIGISSLLIMNARNNFG